MTPSKQIQSMIDATEIDFRMATLIKVPPDWGNRGNPHIRDFCKLYLIEEGFGFIKIDGTTYTPVKGDLVLIPQGVPHEYGIFADKPAFLKFYCHFSLIRGGANLFHSVNINPLVKLNKEEIIRCRNLFKRTIKLEDKGGIGNRLYQRSLTMEFFALFMEKTDFFEKESSHRMGNLIHYIEDHLSEKIDLTMLAEIVHLERSYLVRQFHQTMGVPPLQYINRRRLERACDLLTQTNLSITEIAEKCGFSSLFYFSGYFSNHYDISPRNYRNQSRQRASSNS